MSGGNGVPEDKLIAEETEYDFKAALETNKPKSWLKSVSAFANGIGGTLYFGVDNDGNIIGLKNAQADAESISSFIKDRITPCPDFILNSMRYNGKDYIALKVFSGRDTPYYLKADGRKETYIRVGNESIPAPDNVLKKLLLNGVNKSYDALMSPYDFKDYAFSKLRERYKALTGESMEEKLFDSFEIRDANGKLTNAGALLADDSPVRHSRLFYTRWGGLDKSGGLVDALDSAEFSGSLIILLNEGLGFIKRNMKTMWKKTADSRIDMPDYCERSFFEGLVNALIHRDYLILGGEVHIDIYDDRMTIYSPGGMPDGTMIQDRDVAYVASTRRNPILADIFGRLGYMEHQGSGLSKIRDAYERAANFRKGLEPSFYSDQTQFTVTLPNLNYGVVFDNVAIEEGNVMIDGENVSFESTNALIMTAIDGLKVNQPTKDKIQAIFQKFGFAVFGRKDVMEITGVAQTASGNLINKMKAAGLVEPVSGMGKGKYRFIK